jgi:hypothetical protein
MTQMKIFFSLIFLFLVVRAEAALVRVTAIVDAQTLIVDRAGIAETIKLAGITITDVENARTLLEWTLVSKWVMLEPQSGGGCFVYRSPDALFVNRELVTRGFATTALPAIEPPQHVVVTYLGTVRAPKTPAAAGSDSGKRPSTRARPSRPRRPRKP